MSRVQRHPRARTPSQRVAQACKHGRRACASVPNARLRPIHAASLGRTHGRPIHCALCLATCRMLARDRQPGRRGSEHESVRAAVRAVPCAVRKSAFPRPGPAAVQRRARRRQLRSADFRATQLPLHCAEFAARRGRTAGQGALRRCGGGARQAPLRCRLPLRHRRPIRAHAALCSSASLSVRKTRPCRFFTHMLSASCRQACPRSLAPSGRTCCARTPVCSERSGQSRSCAGTRACALARPVERSRLFRSAGLATGQVGSTGVTRRSAACVATARSFSSDMRLWSAASAPTPDCAAAPALATAGAATVECGNWKFPRARQAGWTATVEAPWAVCRAHGVGARAHEHVVTPMTRVGS